MNVGLGELGLQTYIFYREPAVYLVGRTFESSSGQMKEVNFSGTGAVALWPVKMSRNRELTPSPEFRTVSPSPLHQPALVLNS